MEAYSYLLSARRRWSFLYKLFGYEIKDRIQFETVSDQIPVRIKEQFQSFNPQWIVTDIEPLGKTNGLGGY